jgi:hypothetical protein
MQGMKGKCLRTNKSNSLKPSKLLPHWHRLPKWTKGLEGQYSERSSISCAFLIIVSEIKCTYSMMNIQRKSNYIEDQRLQENKKVRKLQQMKQAIQ